MKCRLITGIILVVLSHHAFAQDRPLQLGLYVVVDEMAAAKHFYRALLQAEPFIDKGHLI